MKIVFVVGASRSGTTMLNRILGQHSEILALNELHYFGNLWVTTQNTPQASPSELKKIAAILLARHYRDFWSGQPNNEEKNAASEIVDHLEDKHRNGKDLYFAILERISQENNISIVSEQTPRYIFHAQQLLNYYPNAYIIQLIRDPRAVLASQKGRWRRKFYGGSNTPWSEIVRVWVNYHPITMCKLWKKAANIGISLTDHNRFMTVRFENIVNDPQMYISNICDFLNLEYNPKMLNISKSGSSNRANIDDTVGISPDVIDAWKNKLNPGEIALCEQITESLMKQFNYPAVTSKPPIISLLLSFALFPIHLIGVALTNPHRAWIQLRTYMNK